MSMNNCFKAFITAITSIVVLGPNVLHAQALEEIVVTAQRRTQSLQEVPISLEAISSAELTRQGYRDLNSLSAFSPTVNVDQESVIGPTISIRGFGTSGNAVTLESATPIFVDGIHFSRMSMMKTAFMDVEQIEVLKGPQPVYFGQNATAGAFNIQSKKPGDVWEGDLDFEYGNRNTQEINGGIGGPINDQWRMRIAGKYEDAGGYLNDVVTGRDLGGFEDIGGRFTLQWLPSDQLTVTAKADYGRIRKDVEAVHMCLTDASLIFGRSGPNVAGANGAAGTIGQEDSIYAAPPVGEGWNTPFALQLDNDCYGSRNGVSAGGPYYQPPDNIREENAEFGALDVRAAAEGFASIDNRGIAGYEDLDIWTTALRFEYEFANGISADFNNGYVRYLRNYVRDNSYSNFFMNFQGREEDYYQWSSELRLSSAPGGTFEWNASAFYQKGDLDVFSSSLRADLRTPQRFNDVWEDQEWFAGSAVLTFNFLDDKASIDVGGRYAHLNKTTYADGYAASWVYNVMPCNPNNGTFGQAQRNNPTAAAIAACTGTHNQAVQVAESQVRFLTDDPYDPANLWTVTYGTSGNQKRLIPPNWLPSQAHAIGLTNPSYAVRRAAEGRDGPLIGDFSNNEFDPQVTLRYRPTDDISLYGRWAQSSKAGGYDTGQTSLSPDGYEFAPEYAETFEVGAKGSYLDGRGRFDATLFTLEFTDLQISVATSDPDNPFINLNAGSQRVRGLEFGTQFAVSDQMTLGLGGAILDGEFTNFPNSSCTIVESRDAASGPCLTAAEAEALNGLDSDGDPIGEDTIDRTGTKTPRTPDWKFIADVDYWMPVLDSYKVMFNAKAFYSDGYTTDFEGFTETVRYDKHGDLNLILGFGDQNDVWSVSLYGRNLFQARPNYHPEFDLENDGLIQTPVSPNNYATYGVKLQYNYQ